MPMWLLLAWGLLADAAIIAHRGCVWRGHDQCSYSAVYPEQYVAYKTNKLSPGSMTGDLTKEAWQEVAWTKESNCAGLYFLSHTQASSSLCEVNPETGLYEKDPSCQSCPTPGAPNEDNWVWSPQYEIAMHLPDLWGILQFEDSVNVTGASYYQEWPSRSAAMAIYYAEHAYASEHGGNYTAVLAELLPYSSSPFPICILVGI
eukprot:Skav209711  [mRNA]  locus=scaffold36:393296:401638:- [translate_table: standard]